MKNIYLIISFLVLSALMYTSCTPDTYELGEVDVKSEDLVEGIAYTIKYDAVNPNIVYLTSLMDSKYQPLWNHPQGRSQENVVTLKIPFAGTYDVQFGVQTRGGYVYGEKVTFDVAEIYPPFIEDELWTIVSGGIGKSKTWYLDLDSEEKSRFFTAPMWFFTGTYEWDNLHTASGDNYIDADPWDAKKAITPNLNETGTEAAWYWKADWAGNSWMCASADFGSMTFDLIGGANVVVDQSVYSSSIAGGSVQEGKYMLDTEKHTIKFTDAYPLHAEERTGEVTAATEFRILYADSAKMQIMVVPSGTCFNYISEEYRDNWVPAEVVEPEPTLPDGWSEDVSVSVSYNVKWVLSPETPFNWANLDGSLMNEWNAVGEFPDWTGFNADVPATYEGFSLSINSVTNEVEYVAPDGTTENGTFILDEKGIYTFEGVTPNFTIGSWVPFKTSEEHVITTDEGEVTTTPNTFRITKIEKDLAGNVTGMWVGVREFDTDKGEYKNQYMVYKLIPSAGGGGGAEAQGTEIAFDNSKLVFGDLESNGNLRLELYNDFGSTVSDPPLNKDDLVVNTRIEVTFTLGGITLTDGATGNYNTAFSLADADWAPQYWGEGTQEVVADVTGDGTYTVSYDPSSTSEGAVVFVIDIKGLATDITDLTAVTATIDKIVVY